MATSRIDFSSPAAGFDQPLALWSACHERVLRRCGLLQLLDDHIGARGVDLDAANSASAILRYFNEAAPRHHADEEDDLFPRLLQRQPRDAERQAIERLCGEHRAIDAAWSALQPALRAIEAQQPQALDRAAIDAFHAAYAAHIRLEETVLAPAMQSRFDAATLLEVGRAMAVRRGVEPAP